MGKTAFSLLLTGVELRIGEQAHKVDSITRLHMVALEVQCNIFECHWVAVYVEGTNAGDGIFTPLLGSR